MRRYPINFKALRPERTAPPVNPVKTGGLKGESYDVIVVGAGIFGLSVALALSRLDCRVAVLEKGIVGGEASGRAVGFLETVTIDPIKAKAAAYSLSLWQKIAAASPGIGFGHGLAFYASDKEGNRLESWQRWLAQMQGQHSARLLDPARARKLAPEIARDFNLAGAIFAPDDGFVEPRLALPALARLAEQAGAHIAQNHAVRRILVEHGRVTGIETRQGTLKADHVVLAGGIWNSVFARHLKFDLPQLYGFATASEYASSRPLPQHAGSINGSSFRPSPWGTWIGGPQLSIVPVTPLHIRQAFRFRHAMRALRPVTDLGVSLRHYRMISHALNWSGKGLFPFEACPVLATEPGALAKAAAASRLSQAFGSDMKLIKAWAGAIASSPDNLPILDEVPEIKGLHVGAGMYFGLTFGPAMGFALASSIAGTTPPFDLAPYRLTRFREGAGKTFLP